MTPRRSSLSWKEFTWLAGLTIVVAILALFVVSFFTGIRLDPSMAWGFLGIGSALMGIGPASVWRQRNGSGSPPNGQDS